jgi:hypothetical protein
MVLGAFQKRARDSLSVCGDCGPDRSRPAVAGSLIAGTKRGSISGRQAEIRSGSPKRRQRPHSCSGAQLWLGLCRAACRVSAPPARRY